MKKKKVGNFKSKFPRPVMITCQHCRRISQYSQKPAWYDKVLSHCCDHCAQKGNKPIYTPNVLLSDICQMCGFHSDYLYRKPISKSNPSVFCKFCKKWYHFECLWKEEKQKIKIEKYFDVIEQDSYKCTKCRSIECEEGESENDIISDEESLLEVEKENPDGDVKMKVKKKKKNRKRKRSDIHYGGSGIKNSDCEESSSSDDDDDDDGDEILSSNSLKNVPRRKKRKKTKEKNSNKVEKKVPPKKKVPKKKKAEVQKNAEVLSIDVEEKNDESDPFCRQKNPSFLYESRIMNDSSIFTPTNMQHLLLRDEGVNSKKINETMQVLNVVNHLIFNNNNEENIPNDDVEIIEPRRRFLNNIVGDDVVDDDGKEKEGGKKVNVEIRKAYMSCNNDEKIGIFQKCCVCMNVENLLENRWIKLDFLKLDEYCKNVIKSYKCQECVGENPLTYQNDDIELCSECKLDVNVEYDFIEKTIFKPKVNCVKCKRIYHSSCVKNHWGEKIKKLNDVEYKSHVKSNMFECKDCQVGFCMACKKITEEKIYAKCNECNFEYHSSCCGFSESDIKNGSKFTCVFCQISLNRRKPQSITF